MEANKKAACQCNGMNGEIATASSNHEWLLDPLNRAASHVEQMPFFEWLAKIESPGEFKPAAIQIFHHSSSFPKVIGMMLGVTPIRRGRLYALYAEHAHEEADHHLLLLEWMLQHRILVCADEAYRMIPTLETSACVNIGYEFAASADHNGWIATIGCGIELCALK